MKSKKLWTFLIILIALAGAAYVYRDMLTSYLSGANNQARAQGNRPAQGEMQTVAIRPATDAAQVSAAGNLALANQQAAVLQVEGVIAEILVEPGDTVSAGDLLLSIAPTELERAVQRANLSLAVVQNQLAQLHEPADPSEIEAARANLAAAKENLAELEIGPSAMELQAAQVALTAAQASYQDLLDGQSEAELTQLSAELHKAFITLEQAQEAYNEIAYRGDIGGTQQAMDLQTATIDYDTAKAAYEVATASASQAEIQAALQSIIEAQVQLETLSATKAELASAQAQVADAESNLASLLKGPTDAEIRAAELAIEEAQFDFEDAQADLEQARLRAPIDGTILTVDVEVGQRVNGEQLSALTLADLTDLELPVHVAEVDISKVEIGQPVKLAVDALPDQVFNGEVSRIAPTSEADSGVVNYEVYVQLKDLELADGVRPGMTAVATILGDGAGNTWLVPSNALVEFEGETTILIMRDGRESRIVVTPGSSQGEWTVVESAELKAGDEVFGEVTTFINQEDGGGGGFRGGFGGGPRR